MKSAILILAHKNERQINKIIEYFNPNQFDFYIHVDKKSTISIETITNRNVNVTVVKQHYDIELFSFEMIEAELALLKESRKRLIYSYYILISGQDFPIISPTRIERLLSENYPKDYIDITPLHKGNWVFNSFDKSNCFKKARGRAHRFIERTTKNRLLRYILKLFIILPMKCISCIYPSPYKVLRKNNVNMYGGSQWWVLSDKTISRLLPYIDNLPKDVFNALKRVGSPDECFFQTCIMNSCDVEEFEINDWQEINQNNLTYTCFNSTGHPNIIVSADLKKLLDSGKIFARKFDEDVDTNIIKMIIDTWREEEHRAMDVNVE